MRVLVVITVALIVALTVIAQAEPASAHAALISSEPADGAVIREAPSRLILTFNEIVTPLVIRLVAPDGASMLMPATAEHETSLAITPSSRLREGTHTLSWRVVSLDGHPVGGTIVFSIGAPSRSPALTQKSTVDPVLVATLWGIKIVFYAGIFIGIGGSFFVAWIAPSSAGNERMVIAVALSAGLLAVPMLIGLQGVDALERPFSGLASKSTWQTGLETSFGATAIATVSALFAAFFALETRAGRGARALSLFAVTAAGLALSLSGHASSAAPQWLMRPAVFVHAVSIMFWIGSLAPLGAVMLRETAPEACLARFSRVIPWAVAALLVSGVILAVVQVEQLSALITTAYGLVFFAKLCFVAVLLALAAWNRFRLTPVVMVGSTTARRRLARSISLEVAIAFVVLGLVAMWRFTPPPRALSAASAKPALVHIHTAAAMADVTFEPGHAGIVQASIVIMKGDFSGLDAKEVRLTLENKTAGIEAISRPATRGGDALWRVQKLPIPSGGRWTVQVDILVNDFEKIMLEDQVDIRD